METGIVGNGNVGAAPAKRLGAAGHQIMLSFKQDANELDAKARRYGARTGTPSDAEFWRGGCACGAMERGQLALRKAGPLQGKILWYCNQCGHGRLEIGTTTSAGEIVSRLAPGARVVKAIPPSAQLLLSDDPMIGGKPVACLLCGDDAAAKATVMPLVSAFPAQAVDFGSLANARFAKPAMMVIVRLAFNLNRGDRLVFALLTEDTVAPPRSASDLEVA
jgi:8-hydroxy-5-deazaflavin:NADPH oxidoreductase